MKIKKRPSAPLAQLRDVEPMSWNAIYATTDLMQLRQALAAALLEAPELAGQIIGAGSGWSLLEWPDLTPNKEI